MRTEAEDFEQLTQRFRRELLAHCYRMLGSVDDAEEAVQDTFLRAWRGYGGFERRASVRGWLYRIATNVCLTMLERRPRRMLPSGLGAPSDDPGDEPSLAPADSTWLQPIPDALLTSGVADDPAEIVAGRASVRLALIASLQHLPPRQRAVLILRDVLAFPAAEVAAMLDTSTPAVKSALQRARRQLADAAPQPEGIAEPTGAEAQALLDRYTQAFERSDPDLLERTLRDDAMLEMTPARTWFAGKRTCMRYLRTVIGAPGDWQLVRMSANGQPAVAAYHRDGGGGGMQAFAIVVLGIAADGIQRITLFGDPELFDRFGVPRTRRASSRRAPAPPPRRGAFRSSG